MKRRTFFLSPLALVGVATAAVAAPKVGTLTLQLDPAPFLALGETMREQIDAHLVEIQREAAAETRLLLDEIKRLIATGAENAQRAAETQLRASSQPRIITIDTARDLLA